MPELPEVETVRLGLVPFLEGAVVRRVALKRADLRIPFPRDFARRLSGATVRALTRRGKFLIADLSTGESLILHLGMTGRFTIEGAARRRPGAFYYSSPPDPAHDHVVFDLERGKKRFSLVYNDARRFGLMDLAPTAALASSVHFGGMGPEPLSDAFTVERFAASLKGRSAPIKAALLDQRVVAGLGNIYVCEALFRARLSPRRRAGTVAGGRAATLHAAIVAVLKDGIAAGGATLRDFAGADGRAGAFQERFLVYDREGESCPSCGKPVRRLVQSGRSTFYCAACQR
jgi:formamidopyrimidine-DNA glycosylase